VFKKPPDLWDTGGRKCWFATKQLTGAIGWGSSPGTRPSGSMGTAHFCTSLEVVAAAGGKEFGS